MKKAKKEKVSKVKVKSSKHSQKHHLFLYIWVWKTFQLTFLKNWKQKLTKLMKNSVSQSIYQMISSLTLSIRYCQSTLQQILQQNTCNFVMNVSIWSKLSTKATEQASQNGHPTDLNKLSMATDGNSSKYSDKIGKAIFSRLKEQRG